jgi:adenine-specific DNA methylase
MPTLLEIQFPIAQLSLESYLERSVTHGKILNSLGKWWGAKPFVLTRSIILASLFEASDDPDRWPEDLEIFLRLMCLDNAGMWKRRNPNLDAISSKPAHPSFASLCYAKAGSDNLDLFKDEDSWAPRMSKDDKARREALEKRVFYSLGHTIQRRYTMRVEEIDGPPEESWSEINAYCGTHASSLAEWVNEMSQRRFGHSLKVGDAFSGMGSIPFEAAELGCDVHASDLNPVAPSVFAPLSKLSKKLLGLEDTFFATIHLTTDFFWINFLNISNLTSSLSKISVTSLISIGFLKSGLSVPNFNIASLYLNLLNGVLLIE